MKQTPHSFACRAVNWSTSLSEKVQDSVRELFMLARERAPAIVFIDEIDAVGGTRTNDGTSGSAEVQRTLMRLLAEMDGFDNRGDVRVMALRRGYA